MTAPPPTGAGTSPPSEDPRELFSGEYEAELESWLRRRFRYLCITYILTACLQFLWAVLLLHDLGLLPVATSIAGRGLTIAAAVYYLVGRNWDSARRAEIISAASQMILVLGALSVASILAVNLAAPGTAPSLLVPIFFWHFSACLLLPWTPRESMRPFIPLYAVWAVVALLTQGTDLIDRMLEVIFGPAIFLPGLGVAAWRLRHHVGAFRVRMVDRHFLLMRRELNRARTIHESLFPDDYDDGFVRFEYSYTPARDLGGDYVHLHVAPDGIAHVCLVDVTGHGLAAALTVNRLYGELERIRAERPRAQPGEVITLLNRYVYLTMARHNIYATAVCVTVDPYAGALSWASAGHPPGFLRTAAGGVEDLVSTTVILGAVDPEDFPDGQEQRAMQAGDTVVLFTDGAFESRDRSGEFFGLDRIRALAALRTPPRRWPSFIAAAVRRHTYGGVEDDMLVAALTLGARRAVPSPARAQERQATT